MSIPASQLVPSKPATHSHSYPFTLSLQVAPCAQGDESHSLTSTNNS